MAFGWAFAESWIPKMLEAGLSKNAMQSQLRSMGWKGRRARLFAVIDQFKGVPISKKALKSMPKFLTPEKWMTQATSQKLKERYLYKFDIRTIDPSTGKPRTITRSMYKNRLISNAEAEQEMLEAMGLINTSEQEEVLGVEVVGVIDRDKELF